jgi:hypothetical protein
MKAGLLFILICQFISAFPNQVRNYVAARDGVTIVSVGGFDDSLAQQKRLNNLLDYIVTNFKKDDTPILILLGSYGIQSRRQNFISVGFDDFLLADSVFISDEYLKSFREMYKLPADRNWIFNESYPFTLLDSLYNKSAVVGLKIRYYGEFDSTQNYYHRILSITDFAVNNKETIKAEQRYIKFPYYLSGLSTSVLTYDIGKLNSIKVKKFDFSAENYSSGNGGNIRTVIWSAAILTFLVVIALFVLKIRSKRKLLIAH